MPALAALGTVVVGVVLGVVLFATDHTLLGLVAFLGCLPFALGVWVMMRDRY
jgi:hypothetical protein